MRSRSIRFAIAPYVLRLADGADRGDGGQGRGRDLPRRHRRRRQNRGADQGIRGALPVALHRRRARLHRRHAAHDAAKDRPGDGDAEGQDGGDAPEEAL